MAVNNSYSACVLCFLERDFLLQGEGKERRGEEIMEDREEKKIKKENAGKRTSGRGQGS